MQISSEEERKKADTEKIDQCMAKLTTLPFKVSDEFVKTASFNDRNNFEIGEIVITQRCPSGNIYYYSCVTGMKYDMLAYPPQLIVNIKRNYPLPNSTTNFSSNAIGKLREQPPVASLKQLSTKKIINSLKTDKLKYEDIKPPKLPQELFDEIMKSIIEEYKRSK